MNPSVRGGAHPQDAQMFRRPDRNRTNAKRLAIKDAKGSPTDNAKQVKKTGNPYG